MKGKKMKKNNITSFQQFPKLLKLKIQLNHAEVKISMLEEIIKNKLYKSLMDRIQEPNEIERLRKENKILRAKCKELKEKLKGDNNGG